MRVEVEPRHQEDAVDADLPLLAEHALGLLPEDAWGGAFVALRFAFAELLAFGEANADEADGYAEAWGWRDWLVELYKVVV